MTTRAPADTRLLVAAIVAASVSSLLGLSLAMTGMIVDMGAMFTRYLVGAAICIAAVVLAGFAVEVGFRGLPKGAAENTRAWWLVGGSVAMLIVTAVWMFAFPVFFVTDIIE